MHHLLEVDLHFFLYLPFHFLELLIQLSKCSMLNPVLFFDLFTRLLSKNRACSLLFKDILLLPKLLKQFILFFLNLLHGWVQFFVRLLNSPFNSSFLLTIRLNLVHSLQNFSLLPSCLDYIWRSVKSVLDTLIWHSHIVLSVWKWTNTLLDFVLCHTELIRLIRFFSDWRKLFYFYLIRFLLG